MKIIVFPILFFSFLLSYGQDKKGVFSSVKEFHETKLKAEDKDDQSQFLMGQHYYYSVDSINNYEKAFHWYSEAMLNGNTLAAFNLVNMLYEGIGTEQDKEFGAGLLIHLAEEGTNIAQYALAQKFEDGDGVEKNDKKALYWFQKSAENGLLLGQRELGYHFAQIDPEKSYSWFLKCATKGDGECQTSVAIMNLVGQGVIKDLGQAFKWARKAADNGDAKGEYILSTLYLNGHGTLTDKKKSFYYCKLSAEQNYSDAQLRLGKMYFNGIGTLKNEGKGFEWCEKSAINNNNEAQFVLGQAYYLGLGTMPNNKLSAKWVRISYENGNEDAKDFWEEKELWNFE